MGSGNSKEEDEDEQGNPLNGHQYDDDYDDDDDDEEEELVCGTHPIIDYVRESLVGYRILEIQKHSPCSGKGLVPVLDFIVGANGTPLVAEDGIFSQFIRDCVDRDLELVVYNFKSRQLRNVTIVPRNDWGGEGLLGLTIKFDSIEGASDRVIHVLQVEKNSPAEKAGLKCNTDFLLGTPFYVFQEIENLNELIQESVAKSEEGLYHALELYVFNSETDQVRSVKLFPSTKWGGGGSALGCAVGMGFIHRLPKSVSDTVGTTAPEMGLEAPIGHENVELENVDECKFESGKMVDTPLGLGTICGRKNGKYVVILDWGLDNNAFAMGLYQEDSIKYHEEK